MNPVLSVRNLKTWFHTDAGVAKAVDGISFDISPGKTMALVGESGCGKSVTSLSIMRLIPMPPGRIESGEILLDGENLLDLPEPRMRQIRGSRVSMIFQEPMTSLNPVFRVGDQVASAIRVHRPELSRGEARAETISLFQKVGIPAPETRVDDYPHQMSGGMRQRVMIAMALSGDPLLLIADEPTTALDVTIQAQILTLLRRLQEERGMSILLITHDLGIVAEMASDVAIMYAGHIVEKADTTSLYHHPAHPYSRGLFQSLPSMHAGEEKLYSIPGSVPAAHKFPPGCRFHPRCPHAMEICHQEAPPLTAQPTGGEVACWLYTSAGTALNPLREVPTP